jgi:hypothetical protein
MGVFQKICKKKKKMYKFYRFRKGLIYYGIVRSEIRSATDTNNCRMHKYKIPEAHAKLQRYDIPEDRTKLRKIVRSRSIIRLIERLLPNACHKDGDYLRSSSEISSTPIRLNKDRNRCVERILVIASETLSVVEIFSRLSISLVVQSRTK